MKKPKENNIAYIDGANLHNGVKMLPWTFDYAKFRVWLKEKYDVAKAYVFIGWMEKNISLYTRLESEGYSLVFKDVIVHFDGKVKGNCDADLIVQAMQGLYEVGFDKAIIVSSDGDYTPLVRMIMAKDKMKVLISTHGIGRCSILLKRTNVKIVYIENQRLVLESSNLGENKKAPDEDKTS